MSERGPVLRLNGLALNQLFGIEGTMKWATTCSLILLMGCVTLERAPSPSDLPAEVRDFPVRGGMSATQVADALHVAAVDVTGPITELRGPFVDNPWSGFYTIEFRDGIVSRVTFSKGNMSVVTGVWVLSEER